jgi:hypothetical protein
MSQLTSLSYLTLSIISVSSNTTDLFGGGGVGEEGPNQFSIIEKCCSQSLDSAQNNRHVY